MYKFSTVVAILTGVAFAHAGPILATGLEKRALSCPGYVLSKVHSHGQGSVTADLTLKGKPCDIFGTDIKELTFEAKIESDYRLHIKIADKAQRQWQVPENLLPRAHHAAGSAKAANIEFSYTSDPFSFKVTRRSDGNVLFDTKGFDLIFENQYLELSSRVPDDANIYGLGEVVAPLRRDNINTTQTLWSRDTADPVNENVYGNHPFYLEHRPPTGKLGSRTHGVFFLNSNGMDILLTEGKITYKAIGGVLDFYFFAGDKTPMDAVKQYQEFIGLPGMIPYWSLGFHQCRWGYENVSTVEWVVDQYKAHNIPLEVMWTDIDYMDAYKDWTWDPVNFPVPKMKSFVDKLHANGQKYVPIVDAAIFKPLKNETYDIYTSGAKMDVFMKNPDGSEYIGQVWPGYTVFPDWFAPKTLEWWTESLKGFVKDVDIDGIWLDMNEVSSFCVGSCGSNMTTHAILPFTLPGDPGNPVTSYPEGYNPNATITKRAYAHDEGYDVENPPYAIHNGNGPLGVHATEPNATHYGDIPEYDVHNLWGRMETETTHQALLNVRPNKRPFIISRSGFARSGVYGGHWTGDNFSLWQYMYLAIPGVLQFQIFGIPMTGVDTCGFNGNTDEELCNRWMQLSAFFPFYRNHNIRGAIPQEAFRWPSVASASRTAINIRYSLLPYWYTLFHESSQTGTPVLRPLFFEFPDTPALYSADRQFLVGPAVLVTPVLNQGYRNVSGVFPGNGKTERWFDWYSHSEYKFGPDANVTLPAPLGHINVAIRGGHVLPMQQPAYTTSESRRNPFELLIALDIHGQATGTLYLDDGESVNVRSATYISFTVKGSSFHVAGSLNYKPLAKVHKITILGLKKRPNNVKWGGKHVSFTHNAAETVITSTEGIEFTTGEWITWY